eukprot:Gb_33088 [translate_table: standard]
MAMAMAAMRRICSSDRLKPGSASIRVALQSTFAVSNEIQKEKSHVTWPQQLNAPLEEVDPEIANIIELEKNRQWKCIEKGLGCPNCCKFQQTKIPYGLASNGLDFAKVGLVPPNPSPIYLMIKLPGSVDPIMDMVVEVHGRERGR